MVCSGHCGAESPDARDQAPLTQGPVTQVLREVADDDPQAMQRPLETAYQKLRALA